MLRFLDSIDSFAGEQVVIRCDLNVPIDEGSIQDAGRIDAAVRTIDEVISKNGRPVICSHLGRPEGKNEKDSLKPVFEYLQNKYPKIEFKSVGETSGQESILLLENLRFDAAETSKSENERETYAKKVLGHSTHVVIDGFGVVHRKQASVYELAKLAQSVAGRTIEQELTVLKTLTENPKRPYALVLGGSKVSDKLGVIDALLPKVDKLLIGGGMMFTFLKAIGHEVGNSLLEQDQLETAREYISRAKQLGVELILPVDVVVASGFAADAEYANVAVESFNSSPFGESGIGLDIGTESAKIFSKAIEDSQTVFWNGPMGVFEFDAFAHGTKTVATALTKMDGFGVVGGGDSAAAVRHFGFEDNQFGHISTGGGASLEYLEGKSLPGLEALND
ncbi:MAG: phosphoglycerate kinase [Microbacteriaceae bacterium]|nr:phosphoglycerate kinase [Microbacteriaceae bacterium]